MTTSSSIERPGRHGCLVRAARPRPGQDREVWSGSRCRCRERPALPSMASTRPLEGSGGASHWQNEYKSLLSIFQLLHGVCVWHSTPPPRARGSLREILKEVRPRRFSVAGRGLGRELPSNEGWGLLKEASSRPSPQRPEAHGLPTPGPPAPPWTMSPLSTSVSRMSSRSRARSHCEARVSSDLVTPVDPALRMISRTRFRCASVSVSAT